MFMMNSFIVVKLEKLSLGFLIALYRLKIPLSNNGCVTLVSVDMYSSMIQRYMGAPPKIQMTSASTLT